MKKHEVVAIPEPTLAKMRELYNHYGASTKLATAAGVYPTYFNRIIRGEQNQIAAKMLPRVEKILENFEAGKRTGPPYQARRKPRGRTAPAQLPGPALVASGFPDNAGAPVKAKRKYKARGVKQVTPIVEQLPPNYLNGNREGLMAILDGMAIQAEIMRRTVTEYLSKQH